jgi:quinol monooxygenase YgiN
MITARIITVVFTCLLTSAFAATYNLEEHLLPQSHRAYTPLTSHFAHIHAQKGNVSPLDIKSLTCYKPRFIARVGEEQNYKFGYLLDEQNHQPYAFIKLYASHAPNLSRARLAWQTKQVHKKYNHRLIHTVNKYIFTVRQSTDEQITEANSFIVADYITQWHDQTPDPRSGIQFFTELNHLIVEAGFTDVHPNNVIRGADNTSYIIDTEMLHTPEILRDSAAKETNKQFAYTLKPAQLQAMVAHEGLYRAYYAAWPSEAGIEILLESWKNQLSIIKADNQNHFMQCYNHAEQLIVQEYRKIREKHAAKKLQEKIIQTSPYIGTGIALLTTILSATAMAATMKMARSLKKIKTARHHKRITNNEPADYEPIKGA